MHYPFIINDILFFFAVYRQGSKNYLKLCLLVCVWFPYYTMVDCVMMIHTASFWSCPCYVSQQAKSIPYPTIGIDNVTVPTSERRPHSQWCDSAPWPHSLPRPRDSRSETGPPLHLVESTRANPQPPQGVTEREMFIALPRWDIRVIQHYCESWKGKLNSY